jgi:hypothetical protein
MLANSFTFRITPEVPPSYHQKLFDFIYTQYILPQKQRFIDIVRESTTKGEKLTYLIVDSAGNRILDVELKSGNPLN